MRWVLYPIAALIALVILGLATLAAMALFAWPNLPALDTLTDCGACGTPCAATGATTSCAGGTCAIVSCTDPLTGDCNGSPFDGCEADLRTDVVHCGSCGMPCDPADSCIDGTCVPM